MAPGPGSAGGDDPFETWTVAGARASAVVHPAHARRLCAGHFPGAPLLPGAALAGLMAAAGARLLAGPEALRDAPALTAIERCLFLARAHPDVPIRITATRTAPDRVDAEVHAGNARAACARLRFGGAA